MFVFCLGLVSHMLSCAYFLKPFYQIAIKIQQGKIRLSDVPIIWKPCMSVDWLVSMTGNDRLKAKDKADVIRFSFTFLFSTNPTTRPKPTTCFSVSQYFPILSAAPSPFVPAEN